MITLVKDQLNNIYLTLKDNGFNYSAYTLSVFDLMEKKTTEIPITVYNFTGDSKYSQFQITDPTDINLFPGSYTYKVLFSGETCEYGLLRVAPTTGATGNTIVSIPEFKNKTEYATFRKR